MDPVSLNNKIIDKISFALMPYSLLDLPLMLLQLFSVIYCFYLSVLLIALSRNEVVPVIDIFIILELVNC